MVFSFVMLSKSFAENGASFSAACGGERRFFFYYCFFISGESPISFKLKSVNSGGSLK